MSGDYREPYFEADGITIFHGDCIEVMAGMDAASVDAVVTDPPYGLGFMGKAWDTKSAREFEAWCEAWGRAALRVARPGAHLLAFGAPRTSHRLVAGLEDAGWEIRDTLAYMFGSGFPKSLNLGDGRGTALKPAYEPVVLARKPLSGTVAATVAEHGTGALNIDACRIDTRTEPQTQGTYRGGSTVDIVPARPGGKVYDLGRWPANVVLDETAAAMLDAAVGDAGGGTPGTASLDPRPPGGIGFHMRSASHYGDSGGPSRFFYTAKASRAEREAGLSHLEPVRRTDGRESEHHTGHLRTSERRNHHPTVKPVALMRWLVRMVTPPGGVVLDPFMGSGSTRIACQAEGARFIGIEQDAEYLAIAVSRLAQLGMVLTEGDEA